MKKPFLICCLLVATFTIGQTNPTDEELIKAVLETQRTAWNNHDLSAFMETYWKSDALTFYGSSGVVRGWQATMERYQKSYPTPAHFGQLRFVLNDITEISDDAYYVLGEFYLTREVGNAKGIFMLVMKKIEGDWKIVADTSCTTP
ncbi:nuclear transport factor 2 family protein [Allomuricauda sp. d1]|uniref:YybH family protein n=1 Tax=Allomuricauda sp. d1 TaxID=3136725 RepID=UPI0031DC354A